MRERLLSWHGQVSDLLPIGCLIVVCDQAYHCCVIGKLNSAGVVPGHAAMSELGVQDGTEHSPLRAPVLRIRVADVLLALLTTWWAACREVQDPVAEGGV